METEKDLHDAQASRQPAFVPLLLVVIALLLMTAFQTIQLSREHDLLKLRLETQTGPLEESRNVREQLQSIATSTGALAQNGNENAARIVELMQRAGIKINADGS